MKHLSNGEVRKAKQILGPLDTAPSEIRAGCQTELMGKPANKIRLGQESDRRNLIQIKARVIKIPVYQIAGTTKVRLSIDFFHHTANVVPRQTMRKALRALTRVQEHGLRPVAPDLGSIDVCAGIDQLDDFGGVALHGCIVQWRPVHPIIHRATSASRKFMLAGIGSERRRALGIAVQAA